MNIIGKTFSDENRSGNESGQRAFFGRILHIHLSDGKIWVEQPGDSFYRRLIGGRGVILHYLLQEMPAWADPLGPENMLIFAPGILSGTVLPGTGRHAVGAKSPLTGALASSEAGGWWGAEFKKTGFDAMVIRGRAETPVYLWIKDGDIEIRDASHLWGKTTGDTQESIRQELGDEKIRIAQIGPAGEEQVLFAAVMHDVNRAAGRSGLGAVMGSKNLKAVAVRGTSTVGLADKELMTVVQRWINKNYKESMGWAVQSGTAGSVIFNHDVGGTAIRNYLDSTLEGVGNLDASSFFPAMLKDRDTCNRCPVRCKLVVEYKNEEAEIQGRYGGPEYESLGALGPLCAINDVVAVAKANELCAAYGLDTISTGGTIAFTMECAEKGLLPGYDFLPRFGDSASLAESIHRIVRKEGIGAEMAAGSARMAEKLGSSAVEMLAVAHKQELPLHDPRLKQLCGMGYALSPTGADHMNNLIDNFATSLGSDTCNRLEEFGVETPLPLWGVSELKVRAYIVEVAFKNFLDSAVICHFYPYTFQHMVDALNAATGWQVTAAEIHEIGDRIAAMARLFLIREGFTSAEDTLSARAFHRLKDGPIAGKALTPEELKEAVDIYYARMGWDEEGHPYAETLERLGVAF
ncbi:MAG: aldehyde ferredoxin oxidoreductase family protein [Anaerolineaceae bacterium]|nr:aldehyde ferredoxin oxidoreductase family protein [Anaerolineaceae bacterium]